jgi:AcrR family transcriptional regulator
MAATRKSTTRERRQEPASALKAAVGARAGAVVSLSALEESCRERRAPSHARGRQRVDAILDAASAIIAERGLTELTVEGIARRSETSKSSMYHFFPDLEAVIEALIERHSQTLRASEELRQEAVDWAEMTTEEAVVRFLEPMHTYIGEHPDFIPLLQAIGRARGATLLSEVDALQVARAERLVAARAPGSTPAQRRARGAAIVGMVVGVCQLSSRQSPSVSTGMAREMKRALLAYLDSLE